jgi:Xaa-Pro aminopeptidase
MKLNIEALQQACAARRHRLLTMLPANSVVIIAAASVKQRNHDVYYPFRQDSNFYYLTGLEEAKAICLLSNCQNQHHYTLFYPEYGSKERIWEGKVFNAAMAQAYGADVALPLQQWPEHLSKLLPKQQIINIYTSTELASSLQHLVAIFSGELNFQEIAPLLYNLRLYKDALEISCLRYAASVSAQAHRQLMQCCRAGMTERMIEAEFLYQIMHAGCAGVAYPSIVAGGNNACILHYHTNATPLQAGTLLLVDAGAEYHNYAADISRTFPINATFTQLQAEVYQLVLEAQLAGIAAAQPGQPWSAIQRAILAVIKPGLTQLGLVAEKYQEYYMHSSGHWLGLDVHDGVASYQEAVLRPQQVFTVEPGLYFSEACDDIPEELRGMGIRIEDDVLITTTGNEVLSCEAPKTIADIQALRAE